MAEAISGPAIFCCGALARLAQTALFPTAMLRIDGRVGWEDVMVVVVSREAVLEE